MAEIDDPGPPIISSGSHETGSANTPLKTNVAGIHQAQDHTLVITVSGAN
jgi:hypothetical protein